VVFSRLPARIPDQENVMSLQVQAPARLPEWFKLAAPRAMFSTKELAEIFGITEAAVHRLTAKGELPEPVRMVNQLTRGHRSNDHRLRWSKLQVLAQIKALRAQSLH
jgi:predicted DNA-binding transcriptional regulator AlpA